MARPGPRPRALARGDGAPEGRVVGLDGVVAQQGNYRKSGFELAWNNVRYQGVVRGGGRRTARVVALRSLPIKAALDYDAAFFPEDRRAFTTRWVVQQGSHALAALRDDGRIAGYGAVRPCRAGCKVGPLFADDAHTADVLFAALAACVPEGATLQLDIPAPNRAALALVKRHGLEPVFETARMYAGPRPPVPLERLYGVTTFELG